MNSTGRDIFKAIHEGKWLSIEYRNKQGSLTKYWIGIYDIDTRYKSLRVEGLHLGTFQNMELTIYIDKIESSKLPAECTYIPFGLTIDGTLTEHYRDNPAFNASTGVGVSISCSNPDGAVEFMS